MKFLKTLTLLITILVFIACSKDDQANRPPNDFTIELKPIDGGILRVKWTPAIDPDENDSDGVNYSVYLNETVVEENTSALISTKIKFSQLLIGKNTIKVVARDPNNATTEISAIYTRKVQTAD